MNTRAQHGDEALGLIAIRRPTRAEARRGAQIVFVRRCRGVRETILAAVCLESWEQWNASYAALCDNSVLIERWRRGEIPGFPPRRDGGA
jgi:hypothetical protein